MSMAGITGTTGHALPPGIRNHWQESLARITSRNQASDSDLDAQVLLLYHDASCACRATIHDRSRELEWHWYWYASKSRRVGEL